MSETKNVVIQQNNGTDYDKLHPEVYDKNVNLSTENASVWGNTLKDALPKINSRLKIQEESEWNVGDIKCSTKDSLGNKWLKCDGSVFDGKKYPDLLSSCTQLGFPFGNKKIVLEKTNIPRKTFKWGNLDGNNLTQHDSSEQINEVNGYYVRFKEEDSDKYRLTIYYSVDNFNWNTGNIIELTTENTFTNGVKGIGYTNGYYYIFFYVNGGCFVYSNTISFDSYTLVKCMDVNDRLGLGSNYVGMYGQDGKLFYTKNGEYSYLKPFRYNSSRYDILSICSKDINFSNPSWYVVAQDVETENYKSMNSFILERKRVGVNCFSSGNSENPRFLLFTIDDGSRKIDSYKYQGYIFSGNVIANDRLYIYARESSLISFYRIEITPSTQISSLQFKEIGVGKVALPTLYRKNGQFVRGVMTASKVSWAASENYDMSNSVTYTDTLTGTTPSGDGEVIFEDVGGIYNYTNNADNNNIYKIGFGGVLPTGLNAPNTVTPINTFIKALD